VQSNIPYFLAAWAPSEGDTPIVKFYEAHSSSEHVEGIVSEGRCLGSHLWYPPWTERVKSYAQE
jgi:hypothetical protein